MPDSNAMMSNNRAELIKSARESCNKNLYHTKSTTMTAKRVSPKSEVKENTRPIAINQIQSRAIQSKVMTFRLMMLRVLASLAILISIVVIDQFKISYKNVNSSTIKTAIQSNESADKAVDIVTKFTKENIISVFSQK